jgi:hypothetical protein
MPAFYDVIEEVFEENGKRETNAVAIGTERMCLESNHIETLLYHIYW